MSEISNKIEDKIQEKESLKSKYQRQINLLETRISEIESYIEELDDEIEALQEEYNKEESKFEPSLSLYNRNTNLGGDF